MEQTANPAATYPGPSSARRMTVGRFFIKYLPFFTTPALLAIVIGIWQWYVASNPNSQYILPPPAKVWDRLFEFMRDPTSIEHVGVTLYETLVGFFLGSVIGISLGFIIAKSQILERTLNPFIIASQVIPKVALVPLFTFWFGFNPTSKIIIATLLAFFPLLSNVVLGIKSVEEGKHDLMNSLAASRWQRFLNVELPFSMPYILTGMEVGVVLALIGAVVGEYLGGNKGLGFLTVYATNAFQLDLLFTVIIVLTVIGFVLYAILAGARRFLIPWHETGKSARREVA